VILHALNMDHIVLVAMLTGTLILATAFFLVTRNFNNAVSSGKSALEGYLKNGKLPAIHLSDGSKTGALLQLIQTAISTLDTTVKEKKDLVTLMSHDIRTPLAQVIGMCSLIQLTEDKAEINEYCQILMNEMTNQLNFLEQIVYMNRLDNMDAAFRERSLTPISELVDRAMHSLNLQTVEKTLDWQFQIEKDSSVLVNAHLFSQALQNVISNAIKFSMVDSSVFIGSHTEKNSTIIEVRDHGLGFRQEDAGALFERFTSKGKPGTKGEKSNGIGLYLTKNIVERHNGKIEAFSSGPGKGATFRITLPG